MSCDNDPYLPNTSGFSTGRLDTRGSLKHLTSLRYSTGKRYEYAYDAVGNRTVYTETTPANGTRTTQYEYDAANRLLVSSSPHRLITYTWDARGNLIGDGAFTYAYNAAGRLARARSITTTVVYTYTADGLRVAQAVAGAVTTYAWDWAQAVPELLSQSTDHPSTAYLVGHETLGWWDGVAWRYVLADALGSVRQAADGAGVVVSVREWTPYGEEVGGWRAGLGYTGEWQDAAVGLVYLRARWYAPGVGRFIQKDPAQLGQNAYVYADANPFGFTEPTGLCAYRPGDPPGTCRVEVGDKNLFRIALAHNIQPWEQIKAWNPELWNPTYQNYLIHIGDLVYLRPREPIPTAQGGSPLDTISGYLEGKMRSSTVACLTWWVEGEEIVYDFALIPPERARFTYRGFGITLSTSPSLADVTDTGYAGFIWGFDPRQPEDGIFMDYEGPSIGASVGVNANLPPGFLDVFTFGVGGGVGGFKSLTSQVFGFYAYTSAGVSAGTPGVALTFSFLGTYYTRGGSRQPYGGQDNPAHGLYSAISIGDGSPVQGNPIIASVRPSVADEVYRVLDRYYATQGLIPSR